MVNGRAIRSSEAIRQERLRRTKQLRKTTRPVVKRVQKRIQKGTMNVNKIFDPMGVT